MWAKQISLKFLRTNYNLEVTLPERRPVAITAMDRLEELDGLRNHHASKAPRVVPGREWRVTLRI